MINSAEHLKNIRTVFDPAISDLATLFDVSRQAIYKWLAKTSSPEPEKDRLIRALSLIADKFKKAGVTDARNLLKVKISNDKSLLDLLKAKEDYATELDVLIQEALAMEKSYKNARLEQSKAKPTDDWKSYMSIPGGREERI